MSARERSDADGKTVIRSERSSPGDEPRKPPANVNSTIFYDGPLQPQLAPARTLIQPSSEHSPRTIISNDEGGWRNDATGASQPKEGGRFSFSDLAAASDNTNAISDNRYVAAATPLLGLLGRLRQLTVAVEPGPLASHIAGLIREFDRKLGETELLPADIRIAKYALCETSDDVVENLPGYDKQKWRPYSMLSQFFKTSGSGTGFFEALNKVLSDAEPRQDLLALFHACLSLGFEGQYRGSARQENLARVRQDVYESLRYFKDRPGPDISPHWQGLSEATAGRRARIPVWAIAAGAVALVAAGFFAMRSAITDEGDALASKLLALNPATPVLLERIAVAPVPQPAPAPAPVEVPEPVSGQLERIRTALADDLEKAHLTVETKGDFIVVEINNTQMFNSGRADLKEDFIPIGERIAAALAPEPGKIKIVGHTDNVKPRKSSAFKSNFDLSVARAKAVAGVVASKLPGSDRIAIEGKGEDEPIADNSTPEGRTKNRRVDILLPREGTL